MSCPICGSRHHTAHCPRCGEVVWPEDAPEFSETGHVCAEGWLTAEDKLAKTVEVMRVADEPTEAEVYEAMMALFQNTAIRISECRRLAKIALNAAAKARRGWSWLND